MISAKTAGCNKSQVLFSLAIAFFIIVCLAIASAMEQPSYVTNVKDFVTLPHVDNQFYRLQGFVQSPSDARFALCADQNCIQVDATKATNRSAIQPNRSLVVFGKWRTNYLEATEIITPCQVGKQ